MKSNFSSACAPAAIAVSIVLAMPQLALAEKLMVIADFGAPKNKRVEAVQSKLNAAGHEAMIAGSSLEDTALLFGCDSAEDACLDAVMSTASVDGLVVVPSDAGKIRTRRGSTSASFAVSSDGGFDAAVADLLSALEPTPSSDASDAGTTSGASLTSNSSTESGGTNATAGDTSDVSSDPIGDSPGQHQADERFSMSRVSTPTWIVLGGGAAATGLGLGLLAIAASKQGKVDDHPVDSAEDLDALRSLEDSGAGYTSAGNLFLVVGGVAVLTGVGLLVWDAKKGSSETQLMPTANASSLGVAFRWTTQ